MTEQRPAAELLEFPTIRRLATCIGTVGYQQRDLASEAVRALGAIESLSAANLRLEQRVVDLEKALGVSDEEWLPWDGEYEKQFYDVWHHDYEVTLACWPNAGLIVATDGSDRSWRPCDKVMVRVSEHQGRAPNLYKAYCAALQSTKAQS